MEFDPSSDALDQRPVKKARLGSPPQSPDATSDAVFDDTEELYDSPAKAPLSNDEATTSTHHKHESTEKSSRGLLPGLGMIATVTKTDRSLAHLNDERQASTDQEDFYDTDTLQGDLEESTELTSRHSKPPALENSAAPDNPTTQASGSALNEQGDLASAEKGPEDITLDETSLKEQTSSSNTILSEQHVDTLKSLDAEDLERDNEAEWAYDSSNPEVDSSSDTSSDNSEDENVDAEDDDYEFLGPEEQARILMREEGASDDDGKKGDKSGARSGPRTTNETLEEKIHKPEVTVTETMEVLELGVAEKTSENHLLIKGTISGETQVLASGSVLCLQDRTVIGVVQEPLGRVEAPLYSVAFSSATEIEEYGITLGTKIFYVKDHSSYVFTQPLKLFKGSDASNIHDEEVGEDEIEFSDDEAEAEYKRRLKQERLAKKGIPSKMSSVSRNKPTDSGRPRSSSTQYPTAPINYDDNDDDGDGLYTPLTRPSDLLEAKLPPKPKMHPKQFRGQAGRGRGTRGRGDRGRGSGGGRSRESRHHQAGRPAIKIPEQDVAGPATGPSSYNAMVQPHFHSHSPTSPQSLAGRVEGYSPQFGSSPTVPSQYTGHWPQTAYQEGYSPQYLHHSPSFQQPPTPGGSIPPGAFVNPAFFRGGQNSPSATATSPQGYYAQPYQQPAVPYQQPPGSFHQPYAQGMQYYEPLQPHQYHTASNDRQWEKQQPSNQEYDPTRPWIT